VRRVEFHPAAEREFISAARFYERHTRGLGLQFISVVQRTTERLLDHPAIGRRFGRRLRRVLLPKFPYGLVYRIDDDRIYIVAVMHLHRRPNYWRPRR